MFAYCGNNPVNYLDNDGRETDVLPYFIPGIGLLPFVDGPLPFGDILGGLIVFAIALESAPDVAPTFSESETDVASGPPSPDDDDDDDLYDDYYDDESNFGGRQKMGRQNGDAPRNNQAQNKQFRDATRGLSKAQREAIHREISHQGNGFHDICDAVKNLLGIIFSFFSNDE